MGFELKTHRLIHSKLIDINTFLTASNDIFCEVRYIKPSQY